MKTTQHKAKRPRRVRRAAPDMRLQALAAARRIIIESPSDALTMRAVADAAGVTHPNLSHHFGSLAGLHAALAEELVRELTASLRALHIDVDSNTNDAAVVDRVFDMFDKEGLGKVLGWLVRSGETARLAPVSELLSEYLSELAKNHSKATAKAVARDSLILAFAAYAESSVGPLLGSIYKISASQRRKYFVELLTALNRFDR
jgi:AcrR family transcriptional regulator